MSVWLYAGLILLAWGATIPFGEEGISNLFGAFLRAAGAGIVAVVLTGWYDNIMQAVQAQ